MSFGGTGNPYAGADRVGLVNALTPDSLPPIAQFPHVLEGVAGGGTVWLVSTQSFAEAVFLSPRGAFPGLGTRPSASVLLRLPNTGILGGHIVHTFVTSTLDLAMDVLSVFIFGHSPVAETAFLFDMRKVYMTHGQELHRLHLPFVKIYHPIHNTGAQLWEEVIIANPNAFVIPLPTAGALTFKAVVCNPIPMMFFAAHAKTVLWVATKADKLLRQTLGMSTDLGRGEMPRLVSSYLVKYALIVLTSSSRITYADVFILETMEVVKACIAATMFTNHPYENDGAYLHNFELRCGLLHRFGTFGNHRIFQSLTGDDDSRCAAQ